MVGWVSPEDVLYSPYALIPIAVAGYLHPMLAAAVMAFSSVSVVVNALWLKWSWQE